MKRPFFLALLIVAGSNANSQNVGINVSNPDVNLSILKDIRIDAENANNGTINNSIRFGPEPTGEYILSKRTAGGNQYGIDFFAGHFSRLTIGNNGDVFVGSTQSGNLLINGTAIVDNLGNSNGTLSNGLRFGAPLSGEGIASNRSNASPNQYGLDFYTGSSVRMSINLSGVVSIDNNPLITFSGAGKQVVVSSNASLSSASLAPGAQVSVTYAYLFNSIGGAWAAGFSSISGECSKVAISTEIINTSLGHYSIRVYATNISNSTIAFNGNWKLMVLGSY